MNTWLRWFGVIAGCFALLACTVMQPLTVDPAQLRNALHSGDQVEVTTMQGQELHFVLDKVDEQGLHGGGQNVAFGEIKSVNRKETSGVRTALLVLGIVAIGAAAAGGGGGGGGGGGY